jgi:hypothetical protein
MACDAKAVETKGEALLSKDGKAATASQGGADASNPKICGGPRPMSERFFTSGTVPAKKASSKKNSSKRQKPSAEEANADKSRQKKKSRREQN